uniref:Uncharacterized protein n=1 Tax=Anguilla anguilla TaxID=7936 RepID=A0A0E9T4F9_ANGAN
MRCLFLMFTFRSFHFLNMILLQPGLGSDCDRMNYKGNEWGMGQGNVLQTNQ